MSGKPGQAHKPYYEATSVGDNADPQKLNDLQYKLLESAVFVEDDVQAFANVWFQARREHNGHDHKKMNAILDRCVERFEQLDGPMRETFRGHLTAFRNMYAFLSQIMPFLDEGHEQLYAFLRNLSQKLPRQSDGAKFTLDDNVALKFFRIQQMGEGSISLMIGDAEPLKGPTDVGTGRQKDVAVPLSSIIDVLNDRFGTDFNKADQLFFDQVVATAQLDDKIVQAANANSAANFAAFFGRVLDDLFIQRMDGNDEIVTRVMTDKQFRAVAENHLAREVYESVRNSSEDDAGDELSK